MMLLLPNSLPILLFPIFLCKNIRLSAGGIGLFSNVPAANPEVSFPRNKGFKISFFFVPYILFHRMLTMQPSMLS